MGKIGILAEKPSVAKNLAAYFNCKSENGYFENQNYVITFAFGHLCSLYDMYDYNPEYKAWRLENFPFIPQQFKYKIMNDEGVQKQFKIIKQIFNRPDIDYLINCCDADREGEAIWITIYNATGSNKPVKRLWISEQTPDAIRNGMNNLLENSKMIPLQQAALTRQSIDWVFGINSSAVASLKYGQGKVLRIGRVILPTIKLLYDRWNSIKKFVPKPFYEVKATFKCQNGSYDGVLLRDEDNTRFDVLSDAESLLDGLEGSIGTVIYKEVSKSKESPKRLFNLNDLQGYITKKYSGFSAIEVGKISRSLYEKKYITYPGTSSRHLDESLASRMEKVLEAISKDSPHKGAIKFKVSTDVFDNKKVESHSAITPTYILPTEDLPEKERIVYEEIKLRFISQFMPAAEYLVTELKTSVNDKVFLAKGKVLLNGGWKVLYDNDKNYEEVDENTLNTIPDVMEQEKVKTENAGLLSGKTSPPKQYTTETLFKAMENCGKDIPDDDVSNILSGFQIGTAETRAKILQNIIDVGYIKESGKSLVITDMGIRLVEKLPLDEFFDVYFTGQLEKKLKDIESGTYTMEEYQQEIFDLVNDCVERMKGFDAIIAEREEKEAIATCRHCGSDVFEGEKAYYCKNFKNGCIVFRKENKLLEKFGMKKIPRPIAKSLIETGNNFLCVNFTKFIIIELVKTGERWSVEFQFPSPEECKAMRQPIGKCPDCNSNIYENLFAYSCDNYSKEDNKGCKFSVYKENKLLEKFDVKKISKQLLKDLLSLKQVTLKVSPTTFIYAQLIRKDERWTIDFKFPSKEESKGLREVLGKCPECQKGNVYESEHGFMCEFNIKDNHERCKFGLFKEDKFFAKFKKKITKSMARSFLKDKKAEVKGLWSQSKGKEFDATILMKKNGEYWNFEFQQFISK